jgi:hypothetical protein
MPWDKIDATHTLWDKTAILIKPLNSKERIAIMTI